MRVEQLTFTRFIAAVGILFFHFGKGIYPFNSGIWFSIANNANIAVSYFFILSGFVMVLAYGSKATAVNPTSYYIGRLAKLYPLYFLALVLMMVNLSHIDYAKLIAEFFLVQSYFPGYIPAYNLPDWSLSVEVLFYLLFPFLYNQFYSKFSLKSIAIIVICVWLVCQVGLYAAPYFITATENFARVVYYHPLVHLNEFIIGNLTGLIFLSIKTTWLKKDIALIGFMLLIGACIIPLSHLKSAGLYLPVNFHDGLLALLFVPFILLLALNKGYISRVFSLPFLVYLGNISYGMYILQFPVFIFLTKYVIIKSPVLSFYIHAGLLIIISSIAYHLIELPAMRYIKLRFKH